MALKKSEDGRMNLRSLSHEEVEQTLVEMGEKPFRAKQVFEWLWKHQASSIDEMTNLSKALRAKLEDRFFLDHIRLAQSQHSADGTIKCAFEVIGGQQVEGVLIPSADRNTACVSSQAGCSLACAFCATGRLALKRNLGPGEIVDQVAALDSLAMEHRGRGLTNIVYMGMGEPLLNYNNVMASIDHITHPKGMGMSPSRITLSTAGIAKMIRKLGDDQVKFNLALSLHAANDQKRNRIMAINESNNLEVLADALRYFYEKTGTRVTYEYIIFKEFNDTIQDAKELAEFCKHIPCKVNIIEYNPIEGGEFRQADEAKVDRFLEELEGRNLIVNVRRSRGKDIDAACGQLANKAGGDLLA